MDITLSRCNWTEAAKERISILKQYEPIQPYLLYELAKAIKADVFLDIGANIGAYSILMATIPTVKDIHAFEPAPDTFGELLTNTRQNPNSSKIKAHRTALSDRVGTVSFGLVSKLSGANSIVETSIHENGKFSQRIDVAMAPLDERVVLNGRVVAAKIDVEGHEVKALHGAVGTLTRNKCLVQIEDYQKGDESLSKFFVENGYRWLFNVGPDQYFSNIAELNDATLVRAFSAASSTAVAENFVSLDNPRTAPVHVGLPFGMAVRFSGALANALRTAKGWVK